MPKDKAIALATMEEAFTQEHAAIVDDGGGDREPEEEDEEEKTKKKCCNSLRFGGYQEAQGYSLELSYLTSSSPRHSSGSGKSRPGVGTQERNAMRKCTVFILAALSP